MPLPLIPAVVILVTSTGGGVAAGVDGVRKTTKATLTQKSALARHARELDLLHGAHAATDTAVSAYGLLQLEIQRDTLGRLATWFEANHRKVNRLDHTRVQGVTVEIPSLPALQEQAVEAANLLSGAVTASMTGMMARQAALNGVRALAHAGTGTAISNLSGIAAQNATLAWLGGGTLAAGGGGIAAGTTMLTLIGIGPGVLMAGLSLSGAGSKSLTRARHVDAQVNLSIERMHTTADLLQRVRRRVLELRAILLDLDRQANQALDALEQLDFDPDQHAGEFLTVIQLVTALGQILSTPLLDEDGNLTPESVHIMEAHS